MDVRLLPWRAALAAGLALTLGAATAASLGARLLPAADDAAVTLVWRVSVLVLLAGITWSLVELLGLAREYRWLAAMKRRSSIDRLLRGDALPRTLAVERGRRIARLRQAEAAVPADLRATLRAEAQAASAAIGSATRFFASLLLLLAVLGTFAGMKAALPRLTAAIRPDAAEVDPASIQQALAGIAAAFGANFLALLGAVILAVLAFGLAAERRHLLAALEHVSERYLYPLLPAGSDVSALQRAVQDMRLSVNAVELVGDGVRDLQSTIRSLEQTLVDAIGDLQSSFSASLQKQAVDIQNQLSASVTRVALGVMNVSEVLGQTAAAYESLLEGLTARDERIARAGDALERIAASLPADLRGAAASTVQAAERAEAAHAELGAASRRLERLHAELATQQRAATMKNLTTAFGAAGRELHRLSSAIASASERDDPSVGEIAASLRATTELLDAMREDITVLAGLMHRDPRARGGEPHQRVRPPGWPGPDTPAGGAP